MSDDKNIWVAAADGDLRRIQELVEHQAISPNVPDSFTYTPMHAAASYAQLDVLAYLVQQGGDVNITDEDGDTPLYTVENIDTARWLIDHGAVIDRRNGAGISSIEHLEEDFPEVAAFLQSRLDPSAPLSNVTSAETQLSQHSQNAASETLTSNLIQSVSDIMQRAEAQGTDPDEELRAAVSRTVLEGVLTGYELSTQDGTDTNPQDQLSKRPRMNGFHDP
ncbi:ankyrin [Imleria badia]|nr:ankyrin [Imleria badia]